MTLEFFVSFEDLFDKIGKRPNDRKITQFFFSLKPDQANGSRMPLHLLSGVNEELKRIEIEGHIEKLEKCDVECFINAIARIRKKKFQLILNDQIFERSVFFK